MKVLKLAVIALTAATIIYARRAAKVPELTRDLDAMRAILERYAEESVTLLLRALRAEQRADTMTAAALTAPTAPSIAGDFAARLRAEREDESNTYGVEL